VCRRNALRTNSSCSASSRFQAKHGAAAAACAVNRPADPASAHRDSRCQAVHRTWARSSGDVVQAGAAYQRDIANTAVTQRIWEQPALPRPSPSSRNLGTRKLTCSLLVKSPTDTSGGFDRSAVVPKGRAYPGHGLRRRVERRAPTQILKAMSQMTSR
jgi:hypothetical protein